MFVRAITKNDVTWLRHRFSFMVCVKRYVGSH